jgi:hypothetical protein
VVDSDFRRVLKRNPTGRWEPCMPPAVPGQTYQPLALSFDPVGNLYLIDHGQNSTRLLQRDPQGNWGILSESGAGPEALGDASAVAAAPNGDIFILDAIKGRWRLRSLDSRGRWRTVLSQGGGAPSIQTPGGIATDALGRLYVTDRGCGRTLVRDSAGKWFVLTASDSGGTKDSIMGPYGPNPSMGIAVDRHGAVYIGAIERVLRWTPESKPDTATVVKKE